MKTKTTRRDSLVSFHSEADAEMADPKPDQRLTLAFSPIITVYEYLPGSQEMTSPEKTAHVKPVVAEIPHHSTGDLPGPPVTWRRPRPEAVRIDDPAGPWQSRRASSPESEEKMPPVERSKIDIGTAKIPSIEERHDSHQESPPSSPELAFSDSTKSTPALAKSRATRKKANKKKNAAAAKADFEAEEAALAAGIALADEERHVKEMNELQNDIYLASDDCKEGAERRYEQIMGHPRKEAKEKATQEHEWSEDLTPEENEVARILVPQLGIARLPGTPSSIESEESVPRVPVTVLAILSGRLSSGSLGMTLTHEALVVLMKAPPLEQLRSVRSLILMAARFSCGADRSDAKELGALVGACLEFKEQLMQWVRKRYQAGIEPHVWHEQLVLETRFRSEAAKYKIELAAD